jgi:heme-degrading monooxygenase HmoA
MEGSYAVIFASTKDNPDAEYQDLDAELMELAQKEEGFLCYESVSNGNKSIFISYWSSKEAITIWKNNAKHLYAKSKVANWYERFLSQICKIESSHEWTKKE